MSKTSSKPKSEYAIQTVANALRVLEVFFTEPEIGVSELARRLDLHKNAAFRLLATLELDGYIQKSASGEDYRLGSSCLELGQAFLRNQNLSVQARPILEALCETATETVHLGKLLDQQVVHLDSVLAKQRVLTGCRVGERLPLHCTALGKAQLAAGFGSSNSSSSEPLTKLSAATPVATLLDGKSELEAFGPNTILDPTKLLEELRGIQMQGYAVDDEEYEAGLCCVAAPVFDAHEKIVAAISISGPSYRCPSGRLHGELAHAVVAAAAQLSKELGASL